MLRLTYRIVSWRNHPRANVYNFGLILNEQSCYFSAGCVSTIASLSGIDPDNIRGWIPVIEDRLKSASPEVVASRMANEVVISEAYEYLGDIHSLKKTVLEWDQ